MPVCPMVALELQAAMKRGRMATPMIVIIVARYRATHRGGRRRPLYIQVRI